MSLTRWDPYREMVSLREALNRLFDESWLRPAWGREGEGQGERQGVFVPIDMDETDDNYVISAPLPGMTPEDVDITITDDTLTIQGEFQREEEEERGTAHVRERAYGRFVRRIRLPGNVDRENIDATFEDGVLKLTAPKTEEAKPKQIEVKVK